ncbi:MAG: biosynthetic-type acetolactate synthase large subunit [Proteobacteria bacterium]|nr:biosynthetic-type acetolactate synthase large subunit [Pseudomonadota bacterium]
MELSGAEIVVQSLVDEGVEFVFGYPGGATLHIYDAIYNHDGINHILTRHEQGAAHAADGYSRSTGKTGVVLVTSGPGATNVVTAVATAHMDSIPMVVLTGQVMSQLIGNDAFQEADIVGITRPCVKHNVLIKDVHDIASAIKKAFHIAETGRPGPVLVDIPKDITAEKTKYVYPDRVSLRSYQPKVKGNDRQIKRGLEMLLAAERPIIYSGGGAVLANAHKELTELAQYLGAPVTNTLMGLGAYPASDAQFVGMLGMHGTYEANMAMYEADLIFTVGARFDDRVTGELSKFSPKAKIVQIDIDPASISKNVKTDIPIVGDVKVVLTQCLQILKSLPKPEAERTKAWWEQINQWRGKNCLKFDTSSPMIKPQHVIKSLCEVTRGEAFVASDVGQHQMFAAQYYDFNKPRRWINSGGLGTMGFGLPAAMGAQFGNPDAQVACVTGDGSILMCIQELATCLQYKLPIKIICLNNRYLGMVRQWQEFFYERRYSHTYMDSVPDFVALAESFGHVGMRIDKPGDVDGALKEAFDLKDRLVFLDVVTDQGENVFPMIPAGAGHSEMVLRPENENEPQEQA